MIFSFEIIIIDTHDRVDEAINIYFEIKCMNYIIDKYLY